MCDYKIEERVLVFCDAHSFSMVMVELGARYQLKRLSDIKPKWSTETMAVWEVG